MRTVSIGLAMLSSPLRHIGNLADHLSIHHGIESALEPCGEVGIVHDDVPPFLEIIGHASVCRVLFQSHPYGRDG